MQSSSRDRNFNPDLAGASPATDANFILLSRCNRFAHLPAKERARGASPRESANLVEPLCLSSHRAGFVNPHTSVRVRPGAPVFRGEGRCLMRGFHTGPARISYFIPRSFPSGDHDVRAASRRVKAFVPVQIRLVTPISHRIPTTDRHLGVTSFYCDLDNLSYISPNYG